jgi:hypothetical protein
MQAGSCGKASDLYSQSVQFESRQDDFNEISLDFFNLTNGYLKYATTASFHNSQFITDQSSYHSL